MERACARPWRLDTFDIPPSPLLSTDLGARFAQVVLPTLSKNRGLQRVVNEYFGAINVLEETLSSAPVSQPGAEASASTLFTGRHSPTSPVATRTMANSSQQALDPLSSDRHEHGRMSALTAALSPPDSSDARSLSAANHEQARVRPRRASDAQAYVHDRNDHTVGRDRVAKDNGSIGGSDVDTAQDRTHSMPPTQDRTPSMSPLSKGRLLDDTQAHFSLTGNL